MMVHMGLDLKWIEWMKACIFSRTMSLIVNGSPTEDFKMHKGLHKATR